MSKEILQNEATSQKERVVRFSSREAFGEAVHYLWDRQPFELPGWRCVIGNNDVVDDLLKRFQDVKEIELVDLENLPPEEAARTWNKRFQGRI